jgi:putative intracellular protease/amidase
LHNQFLKRAAQQIVAVVAWNYVGKARPSGGNCAVAAVPWSAAQLNSMLCLQKATSNSSSALAQTSYDRSEPGYKSFDTNSIGDGRRGKMKKSTIAVLATCLFLCRALPVDAGQKVLMIVKDGSDAMDLMLTDEIGVMMSLLKEAGYEPVVATESGGLLKGTSCSLQPDLKLGDVALGDYVGVMVPCMAFGIERGVVADGVSLVKDAFDRGIPIAAQQGGVAFLEKAGILKGKRFAIARGYQYIASDGNYQGSDVTSDGTIVTAGVCPYQATATSPSTTKELTRQFIALLSGTGM